MKHKFFAIVAFCSLCLTLLLLAEPGRTQQPGGSPQSTPLIERLNPAVPAIGCALRPSPPGSPNVNAVALSPPPTLDRFRQSASQSPRQDSSQVASQVESQVASPTTSQTSPTARPERLTLDFLRATRRAAPPAATAPAAASAYSPREEIALADPTNYGDRFLNDLQGRPAYHDPIVVLHETVGSASSAINFFQTPHPRDEDQSSYHTLIKQDGTVIYIVPPDKRAFGAGDSIFESDAGAEAVQTHPEFSPSVNNFAYHISLETPPDGDNNGDRHSGYTEAQYQSLAWLAAKTGVPNDRITTHKQVDRSGMRKDPRSFDAQRFSSLLSTYPRTREIAIGCPNTVAMP